MLSLLGLVLLTHPPMLFGGHADWGPDRILGTMFGVISAVGATGAFICIRYVVMGYCPLVYEWGVMRVEAIKGCYRGSVLVGKHPMIIQYIMDTAL